MRWLVLLIPCLAPAQIPADLLGEWRAQVSGVTMILRFDPGGRCSIDDDRGVCKAQNGWLTFRTDDGEVERYAFDLASGRLTLSGGDLDEPHVFQRAATQTPTGRFHQPKWGFSFALPPSWKASERDGVLLLGSETEPGLMLIRFLRRTAEPQLRAAYADGLEEGGMKLATASPIESIRSGAQQALAGELSGVSAEGRLTARVIAVLTPFGDAAVFLGVTTNANYARLKSHIDAMAASAVFSESPPSTAREAIAGEYRHNHSRPEVLNLCSSGMFSRGGETIEGEWLADGDGEQGAITLILRGGNREQLSYRKSGPDLVLNGKHYSRIGDGACPQRSP